MNKILFLILVCKNVIANDEESNEKYIDLLPEEEKQEFLNRIARRILEGIKSDDTPNESHADITDDQLDAHGAFVQEILKEESDNLIKENRRSESKEGDTNDRIETNNDIKNEHSDGGIESNTGDKEENIDLTLREGKRQKSTNGNNEFDKETTPDITYDFIPVKTVYDQFENDVVRVNEALVTPLKEDSKLEEAQEGNLTRKGEEIISTLSKEQERNDNNEESVDFVSDLGNTSNLIIADTALESDKIESSKNLRKYFHNKLKLGTTAAMIDFKQNSNESSTPADYNINDEETMPLPTPVAEEVTDRTANDKDNWVSTQKIYNNFSEEKEEDKNEETTTVYNTTSNDVTVTNKETITTSISAVTKMSNNESSKTAISNVTYSDLYKAKGNLSRSIVYSIEQKGKNIKTETEISTAETDNTEKTSRSEPVSEIITDIQFDSSSVTPNLSTLGVTESENVASPKDIVYLKSVEHNTQKTNSLEKMDKTMLRARLDNSEMSQIEENISKENHDEDSKKANPYEVFEVDPNQPHFMTTNKPLQNGHPLYVPVYNYAPENAFFRPYNKFGPNTEDFNNKDTPESIKDEDLHPVNLVSARNLFSGYSIDKKKTSYDKNKKQTSKKSKPKYNIFMKTVTHNWLKKKLYYNPNDYADLDYSFGRILRRGKKYISENLNNMERNKKYIPDTNEDDHPISTIHKSDSIKDHVRAVRNILYLQNQFGYVPQVNERLIRKANQFIRNGTKPNKLKISMDNYFHRANPVKDTKHKLFRFNKSKVKHKINTNIEVLTPNPLYLELDLENIPKVQNLGTENHSKSIKQEVDDNNEVDEIPFKFFFDAMIIVLEDSIQVKNEKLVKYDWLKTTVNIQAALRKLLDLINQLKYGEHIHPKDVELVKYTIYLFKSSQTALEEEMRSKNLNKIKNIIKEKKTKEGRKSLPKSKAKIKAKDPIKLWKNYATFLRSEEETEEQNNLLSDFEDVLNSFLYNLNDLHDAIKHISLITKFKNQNWLEDLKAIYLNEGNKKNLAKIILHLSLSKLLDSIEDSSTHGVEENFINYLKKNRETVEKSKEECLFVLNVLEELRRLKESVS